jgi:hypothetical protein
LLHRTEPDNRRGFSMQPFSVHVGAPIASAFVAGFAIDGFERRRHGVRIGEKALRFRVHG